MDIQKLRAIPAAILMIGAANAFGQLEEVVVTAQKRAESVQEVPIAITALSSQMLKSSGVESATDLGMVTPGFIAMSGSGYFVPYIRGVGARAITPGNEPTVAAYLDGTYLTDKAGLLMFGFSDVDSIAVLRGPQGTLFGRNATAGAITITTRQPSQEFGGELELTYGSDEESGSLYVTGGLTDTLSGSLSAFFKNMDGYIRNLNPSNGTGDKTGDSEASGVRAKLLWEPTDDFSAVLALDYIDDWDSAVEAVQPVKGAGPTTAEGVAAALGVPLPNLRADRVYAGDLPPLNWHRGQGAALTLNWALEHFDIRSHTAYREDHSGIDLDLDGSPLPIFYFNTALHNRTVQQEITLTSNLSGPFSWVAGAYYVDYEDGYNRLDQNIGLSYPYNPVEHASGAANAMVQRQMSSFVEVASAAFYADVGYEFTDATSIKVGVRYTDEKHTLDDGNAVVLHLSDGAGGITTLPPTTAAQLCAVDPACKGDSTSFEEVTYRFVLNHYLTPDILTYASYNRGFKSGVYNISTIDAANTTATEPETVDAYELGMKGSFLDRRLEVNAALYLNKYKNMQVAVTSPAATQYSINAAEAETSGLELEVKWLPSDNLQLQAGFSTFFTAEFDSFADCSVYSANPAGGNSPLVGADCSGERMPSTPDYTAFINALYSVPLANGSELAFGGVLSYQDEYNVSQVTDDPRAANAPDIDGYETLNLHATWYAPEQAYWLKVWGDNVTDVDTYMGMFTTPFGYASTLNRGRTFGVTVGASF